MNSNANADIADSTIPTNCDKVNGNESEKVSDVNEGETVDENGEEKDDTSKNGDKTGGSGDGNLTGSDGNPTESTNGVGNVNDEGGVITKKRERSASLMFT